MAGFFQRLFSLGKAEAHSLVDQMEDPVKMTEQGIRDLKKDLDDALKAFAEVKAIAVRADSEMVKSLQESEDWERKAMALLQSGQSGRMSVENSERLATEALTRKEESLKRYAEAKARNESQNQMVVKLQSNIERLKTQVGRYENELVTLKARAKTATASKKINKQLSSIDSSGTIAMLERMKDKVEEEESLAIAYGDISNSAQSLEDEIGLALNEGSEKSAGNESLAQLKAKMGIGLPANEDSEKSSTSESMAQLKAKMGI